MRDCSRLWCHWCCLDWFCSAVQSNTGQSTECSTDCSPRWMLLWVWSVTTTSLCCCATWTGCVPHSRLNSSSPYGPYIEQLYHTLANDLWRIRHSLTTVSAVGVIAASFDVRCSTIGGRSFHDLLAAFTWSALPATRRVYSDAVYIQETHTWRPNKRHHN